MRAKTDSNPRSKTIVVGLFGAAGFGREVMPLLQEVKDDREQAPNAKTQLFFVDDDSKAKEVNGYPVISSDEFFALECAHRHFNIAIVESKSRERIAGQCVQRGALPLSIRAFNTTIYARNEIGEGSIICANSTITSNAKIGKFFHLNIYSFVAHDCVIGDFVTFGPNVQCNGGVHIADHVRIGSGAILMPATGSKPLRIGEGAVIGAGAVVTEDVPPFTTIQSTTSAAV